MVYKQCEVKIRSDEKLGFVIVPGPGCEETFEEIKKHQGPHSQRYIDIRKLDQPQETHDKELNGE